MQETKAIDVMGQKSALPSSLYRSFEMTDRRTGLPINLAEWIIPLHTREAIAEMSCMADQMLHDKTNVRDLRKAYRRYTHYLSHTGLMAEPYAVASAELSEDMRTGAVRALFNRVNCQTQIYLSGRGVCRHECCCDCKNSIPKGACLKSFHIHITAHLAEQELPHGPQKSGEKTTS